MGIGQFIRKSADCFNEELKYKQDFKKKTCRKNALCVLTR